MEAAANRLQKEAKGYLDSLRGTLFYILFASLVFVRSMLTAFVMI